jgi:hypothetical protein
VTICREKQVDYLKAERGTLPQKGNRSFTWRQKEVLYFKKETGRLPGGRKRYFT